MREQGVHVNAVCSVCCDGGKGGESLLSNTYPGLLSLPASGTTVSNWVFEQAVAYEAASSETWAWVVGGMGAGLSILDLTPAPQPQPPQPIVMGTGLEEWKKPLAQVEKTGQSSHGSPLGIFMAENESLEVSATPLASEWL